MTESRATAAAGSMPGPALGPRFPPQRYGRRRAPHRNRRWVPVVLAALTVLAMLAVAWQLYQRYGTPAYVPTVTRYFAVTDTSVTIEFRVQKPAAMQATCQVRSRGRDGAEVGSAQVRVGRGDEVTVTYTLTTTARPVTAEVTRCDALR